MPRSLKAGVRLPSTVINGWCILGRNGWRPKKGSLPFHCAQILSAPPYTLHCAQAILKILSIFGLPSIQYPFWQVSRGQYSGGNAIGRLETASRATKLGGSPSIWGSLKAKVGIHVLRRPKK